MNNYVRTYVKHNEKSKLPLPVTIIYAMTAVTVVFHILSFCFSSLADAINMSFSAFLRFLLAGLTSFLPFSLAEALIITLPITIIIVAVIASKRFSGSLRSVLLYCASLLSVACVFYMLFFWVYGIGYGSAPLEEKLGLDREKVSTKELKETALLLSELADSEADKVTFRKKSFSVMPYDLDTLSLKLCKSYRTLSDEHDFISSLHSSLKPVMLSEAMSYTHITGLYTYFTGEANINVKFPDYTIPFTSAHEMAHQRGIAREDEANFVAYLACIESDDPYIRYSGHINMLEYVINALYSADREAYKEVIDKMNPNIYYEIAAFSRFFDKYRNSTASNVSGTLNDTYLKLNGTEGEKSYGMVVDLAVAYYKNKN